MWVPVKTMVFWGIFGTSTLSTAPDNLGTPQGALIWIITHASEELSQKTIVGMLTLNPKP